MEKDKIRLALLKKPPGISGRLSLKTEPNVFTDGVP